MAQPTAPFRQAALRRGALIRYDDEAPASEQIALAALVEFANLGFIAELGALKELSTEALTESLSEARKVIGADRAMDPIYPGFPEQVEALPTLTLLVEQILHYWSGGTLLPDYPQVARAGLPIEDMLRSPRLLKVHPAMDYARLLIDSLVGNPVAISPDDRVLLRELIGFYYTRRAVLSTTDTLSAMRALINRSPNGENVQLYVKGLLEVFSKPRKNPRSGMFLDADTIAAIAIGSVRNLDQLLRVVLVGYGEPAAPKWAENYERAVGNLSNSNSRAVRYRNIPRRNRRAIADKLGALSAGFKADSLVGRRDLWRGVIRTAHIFELKLSPESKRAADIIADNIAHRTMNSIVEDALENRDVATAAALLADHRPGDLLRRIVAMLRLTDSQEAADALAEAVLKSASRASLTTLISAYNGVLGANDEHARVTRVAGLNNNLQDRSEIVKIDSKFQASLLGAIDGAIVLSLSRKPGPAEAVAISSDVPVPLVVRDSSSTDRTLDRGTEVTPVGEGDILRIFSHWRNNQRDSGYMDIGAVVLDSDFKRIAVSTWDSYSEHRSWSTYSGDKHVFPGDEAAEFFDLKLDILAEEFPTAAWVAMTVQSWSGWPIESVDFIAGAMLRSEAQAGEVFDARAVATTFKPTVKSTQAVPFAVNLEKRQILWLDSSNGSTDATQSASADDTVGSVVYDELARPRLTLGQLANLWAQAHGAATVDEPTDRDLILGLL